MKKQLRIFSWGYWGWGNCAEQFIQACDLVEQDRDLIHLSLLMSDC